MDSNDRRVLSNNLLLQLAACDPTPMQASGLFQGAKVQHPHVNENDVESVLLDLHDAHLVTEAPQRLVKELKLYRINTDGRAHLREAGFRIPDRR